MRFLTCRFFNEADIFSVILSDSILSSTTWLFKLWEHGNKTRRNHTSLGLSFSLFYTKYSKKTNQSFHNKKSSVHYKTTQWRRSRNVAFRNEPLLCRSPEGHPGSAGRRKLNERRAELTGSSGLLFCALTMSWVVPIFLASSLRSIVLRYRYLLRSSPSRMFFTGFWRLRLSLCSILDTIDKHVTHISILNCNVS